MTLSRRRFQKSNRFATTSPSPLAFAALSSTLFARRRPRARIMLARRARNVRALAHRALFARANASAASAADAAPIWTGDDDDRASDATNVWTRHGAPEARSFAHRGILAGDDTKVSAQRARGAEVDERGERRARGGEKRAIRGGFRGRARRGRARRRRERESAARREGW